MNTYELMITCHEFGRMAERHECLRLRMKQFIEHPSYEEALEIIALVYGDEDKYVVKNFAKDLGKFLDDHAN